MSDIGAGDWPTWLAAVFAAVAAGATIWTLISQRKQIDEQRVFIGEQSANLALEREELRAARQQRREEQARRLKILDTRTHAHLLNESDDPVTEVSCADGDTSLERGYTSSGPLSPEYALQAAIFRSEAEALLPVVGAGQGATFSRDPGSRGILTFRFTDAAGVRWSRDELGNLTEL